MTTEYQQVSPTLLAAPVSPSVAASGPYGWCPVTCPEGSYLVHLGDYFSAECRHLFMTTSKAEAAAITVALNQANWRVAGLVETHARIMAEHLAAITGGPLVSEVGRRG